MFLANFVLILTFCGLPKKEQNASIEVTINVSRVHDFSK